MSRLALSCLCLIAACSSKPAQTPAPQPAPDASPVVAPVPAPTSEPAPSADDATQASPSAADATQASPSAADATADDRATDVTKPEPELTWPTWPATLPEGEAALRALLPAGYDFQGVRVKIERAPRLVEADLDGDGRRDAAFVIEPEPRWVDRHDQPCKPDDANKDDCWARGGPRTLVIALQREGRVERALVLSALIEPGEAERAWDSFRGMSFGDDRRLALDFEYGVGVEASGETFEIGWRDGAFFLLGYGYHDKEAGEEGWADATHHGWSVDYVTGSFATSAETMTGSNKTTTTSESFPPCATFLRADALRAGVGTRRCPGAAAP